MILFPIQNNTGDSLYDTGKHLCLRVLWRILVASVIFIVCLNSALAQPSAVDPQEKALRTELAKVEKQFGRNRIETFKSRSSLSSYLSSAKRYKDAIPLYQQQLKIFDKYFSNTPPRITPPPHAVTINFMLACAYQETGNYDKAIHHYFRALDIQEKYAYSDSIDETEILDTIGLLYIRNKHYADAIKTYQRRLAVVQEKAGGIENLATADTLGQLGIANEKNGNYTDALQNYERSLAIYENIHGHNHKDVAGILGAIGRIYLRMDKVTDAYFSLQGALSILENLGLAEDQATASIINNLALSNHHYGLYEGAISLYERSLDISEKFADKSAIATNLANLSEIYREQGKFDQALPLAKRALEIFDKSGGEESKRATAMNNLGLIFQAQGSYAEALIYFQKSLTLLESTLGKSHPDVATPLNNLASLYYKLNDTPKALALTERSLAICEQAYGGNHRTTAVVINAVAVLLDDKQKALALFQRSLAILEASVGADHPMTAQVQANIATLYKDDGKIEDALAMYQKSLSAYVNSLGAEHPDLIYVLDEMSDVYYQQHDYKNGIDAIDLAYRIGAQSASPTHWKAPLYLSGLEAFIGDRDTAIYFGKQGINALQELRANVAQIGTEEQKSFLSDKSWLYVGLADLLIQEGRIPEAQQVMAMLKEEEYFDFIRRDAGGDARSTRATYTQREAPWSKRYAEISSQLVALGSELDKLNRRAKLGLTPEETSRRIKLEADIKVERLAFDEYLKELRAEFAKAGPKRETGLAEIGNENLDQLHSTLTSLGHGAVLLQYLVTDTRVRIILTTPQVQLAREAEIPATELSRKIAEFRRVLQNPARDPRPQAQALYHLLIAPVADDLKQAHAQTLMLSLDGSLRYLPMGALYDGKVYLAERYPLAIFTEVAKDKLNTKPEAMWKVAGLGLTQKVGEFSALPSVRQELTGIVKGKFWESSEGVLPGDIYLDKDFTQSRLHEVLDRDYSVLHISSHFKFIPGTEAQSFLLLGDGTQLSLAELRTGGWKFNTVDLMTLSACETGLGGGRDANGREIEGFGVLAQRQGAKGVLATLWPVADQSTAIFMQTLYRLRQEKGLTKAEALREAQLALLTGKHTHQIASRKVPIIHNAVAATADAPAYTPDPARPYAHPYYWAPFILMGNWL